MLSQTLNLFPHGVGCVAFSPLGLWAMSGLEPRLGSACPWPPCGHCHQNPERPESNHAVAKGPLLQVYHLQQSITCRDHISTAFLCHKTDLNQPESFGKSAAHSSERHLSSVPILATRCWEMSSTSSRTPRTLVFDWGSMS